MNGEQMSERLLDRIESPADVRALAREQVEALCCELRDEIVQRVAKTGGHLASSLGAVELITVIHHVFDTPTDRLVLDVGHQGYAHKMLTGRRGVFDRIGKEGGIGKFLRRGESRFDHFGAGHAGTSISAALGIARAKQHRGQPGFAIALIGDGGMTSGMAFEALNHAGELQQKNLLVVLNDNEMSIAPNVGALSSFLSRKMSKPLVRRLKSYVKDFLGTLPGDMVEWAHKAEESFKAFISPSLLFEALGFRYLGPIRGNRVDDVLETFENARRMLEGGEGPILIHALTAKGHGYAPAEADPFKYHGVTPFEIESGEMRKAAAGPPSYTRVFSDALIRLADEDPRIVAIGETGLDYYRLTGDLEWQRERFRTHIRAARRARKPLVIHTRAAAADTLAIMREEGADAVGGVMHCFTETLEVARAAVEMGFCISFSGIVTFKSAQPLREVAQALPLDRILVETDAPYLAPVPFRGKTNDPAFVRHVAAAVAGLRKLDPEAFAAVTTANFFRTFAAAKIR